MLIAIEKTRASSDVTTRLIYQLVGQREWLRLPESLGLQFEGLKLEGYDLDQVSMQLSSLVTAESYAPAELRRLVNELPLCKAAMFLESRTHFWVIGGPHDTSVDDAWEGFHFFHEAGTKLAARLRP